LPLCMVAQILMAQPSTGLGGTAAPGGGTGGSTTEQLETLGELMYQSHASYSRCGLGSEGTDRLVELVR
jgi:hypothetical protein